MVCVSESGRRSAPTVTSGLSSNKCAYSLQDSPTHRPTKSRLTRAGSSQGTMPTSSSRQMMVARKGAGATSYVTKTIKNGMASRLRGGLRHPSLMRESSPTGKHLPQEWRGLSNLSHKQSLLHHSQVHPRVSHRGNGPRHNLAKMRPKAARTNLYRRLTRNRTRLISQDLSSSTRTTFGLPEPMTLTLGSQALTQKEMKI